MPLLFLRNGSTFYTDEFPQVLREPLDVHCGRLGSSKINSLLNSMQVYIQQTTSNSFYSDRGWVQSVLEANVFATSIEALNFCARHALANVHIRVHSSENPEFDTIFSVTDFPQHTKVQPIH